MTWRDIPAANVDWSQNSVSKIAGHKVRAMCNKIYLPTSGKIYQFSAGSWHDKTLGEIADLGVSHWLRCSGIGDKAVQVIMEIIDLAAEGKCPMKAGHGKARDAYVPKSERK